ncbi:hypothetical protein ACFOLJ_20600 [Rugamonas sp. CCM 8940]|uniref:hypothetical protein n=1 Tax=Rugamonas sp. CCM 8940 TaxID=2765359 RepID=UPI0018F54026|nr:hypothetical protein [Rugamonas sp. CCM 8940]MBJ7311132.1 hypothetical protein [Rugamonas sp. CCM 8940]
MSTDDPKPWTERPQKTNVIDIFRPGLFDVLKDIPGCPKSTTAAPDIGNPDAEPQPAKERERTRDGYSSTPRLERFIDCWLQFEGVQLKARRIS